MLVKIFRRMRRHLLLTLGLIMLFLFMSINIIAFNHAHAMTHFRVSGSRTGSPESLSSYEKASLLLLGVSIPRPVNRVDPASQGLSFQTSFFQGKDGINLEAWLVPHPDAKGLIVLLHGYGACKANVLPEAKAFHDIGYSTVLLDQRGSGGSAGNTTTIGVHEADDLAAVVHSLQAAYPDQTLILYGQSMGSVAILRATSLDHVQPSAVILECPFDRLLTTVGNRFTKMGLPAFPGSHLLVFWGGIQNGFNGFTHNPVDYAREVRCPVLMMHGAADTRVTLSQAKEIFDNVPTDKEFEVFSEVSHQSYLGAKPDQWRQRVAEFLAKRVP